MVGESHREEYCISPRYSGPFSNNNWPAPPGVEDGCAPPPLVITGDRCWVRFYSDSSVVV